MSDNVGLWFRMVRANWLVIYIISNQAYFSVSLSGMLLVECCDTAVLNALL